MNRTYTAMASALLLTALGLTALPHALLQDHIHDLPIFQLASLPFLIGLGLGIGLWWTLRRNCFDIRRVAPACWLALSVISILLPLTWSTNNGRHQYPGGIDPVLLALPFFAAWMATLDARWGKDAQVMSWLRILGGVGVLAAGMLLVAATVPSVHALFLPALLVFAANPSLRRIGWVSLLGGVVTVLGLLLASPFRLARVLNHGVLPYRTMLDDPYGVGYQCTHIYMTLRDMGWFGAESLIHLPEASGQLLAVSIAGQWGALAFVGVLLLVLVWFALTWLGRDAASANQTLSRMLWWALLYFAAINIAVSLLILGPVGPGMVMLSPNAGLTALAWLVIALQDQETTSDAAPPRWPLAGMLAGWVALCVAVAVMPAHPGTTESSEVKAIAIRALDKALHAPGAHVGSVVVLNAASR